MAKLTRQQKIDLLTGIQAGRIPLASLRPPQMYLFMEDSDRPGIFVNVKTGEEYTEQEYNQFIADVKAGEPMSRIWNDGMVEKNTFVTLVPAEGCEPLVEV
jgi:hypothetical protein